VSFVEWIFLLGGLAAVGPVIAHLLGKPRFRRLPFTMLRFLRAGQIESQSRRRLRDLLILLLRCAIIVLIAMLFARPALHVKPRPEKVRHVYYLGLDNSASMAYSDGTDSYIDRLVALAADYIRSADPDGLFNICALASRDWTEGLSREQALAELTRFRIEPRSANVGDFLSALANATHRKDPGDLIWALVLSDFTPKTLDQFGHIDESIAVDNIDYRSVVSKQPTNNAAVLNVQAAATVDAERRISDRRGRLALKVTVINYGQVEQSRRLTAKLDSYESPPVEVHLAAGQRDTYQVDMDLGAAGQEQLVVPVELRLSAKDGLKMDDTFRVAVSIPQQNNTNILLVDDATDRMFLLRTAIDVLSQSSSYNTLRLRQVLISELDPSQLRWADTVVCSAIVDRLAQLASDITNFVESGGRIIFFATDQFATRAANELWRYDVLPVLPGKCVHERVSPEPRPCDSQPSGTDTPPRAAKSLSNYRIDQIAIKGYLQCEQHDDTKVLWQFAGGTGFIYVRRLGNGTSIFVNTSADDSLGPLTKSRASVALCRYLLGEAGRISQHSFACGEPVALPLPHVGTSLARGGNFWVETCNGQKKQAVLQGASLSIPDPGGIGWVRTIGKPATCAGVNLPDGETDMTKPSDEQIANIMDRVFKVDAAKGMASARGVGFDKEKRKPIWKTFAWAIIILLLVEPAAANRLKR
jgi:hypothetical protein